MGALGRTYYVRTRTLSGWRERRRVDGERTAEVLERVQMFQDCAIHFEASAHVMGRILDGDDSPRGNLLRAQLKQEQANLLQAAFELAFKVRQLLGASLDGLVIGEDAADLGLLQEELGVLRETLGYDR